jgi:transposase-like protein
VSSATFDEAKAMFQSLSPDERKAFTAFVKATVQAQGFNLNDLIASKEDDGIACPHCHHREPKGIVKYGVRKGIQWYKCKPCGGTFSGLTGTLWSRTKKEFHVWKKFFKCMMEGYSVRKAALVCNINRNTAWVWRHKILDALTQYQNNQGRMKGIVEADDTFFSLSYKRSKPMGREAHKRGTPATKPGTSKEKVCVSCAVDRSGYFYSRVSALGRSTAKALQRVFRKRISKRAIVCTDNDRAYIKFAKRSQFQHIRVPNGIRLLGTYHVQNINAYHSRLKHFASRFKGMATKYLNNYLVWFNLIQEGGRNRTTLLKLAVRARTFERWVDINRRPAVPEPALERV